MKTYPIMLDVRGKSAVVIGGGPVALRKVVVLLEAGAKVTLVAPEVKGDAPGARVLRQPYSAEVLAEAFLVFSCTDDRELNSRVAADARAAGALVNAADQPEDCDFYVPAVIADGDVIIAIGTGGSAPGLAASLRRRLTAAMPPRVGEFAALLNSLRAELRPLVGDVHRRGEIMKALADDETYDAFLVTGESAVREKLRQLLNRK